MIDTRVEPADPDEWVRKPIPALANRSFLDAYNGEDGETTVAAYFADLQTFEHNATDAGREPEDLGALLNFDAADLDSNRAGVISAGQRSRLWHRDELQIAGAAICLIAGVAFNVALLAHWTSAHGRGAFAGVALMLLGAVLAATSWVLWVDLATGTVAAAEGELSTDMSSSMRSGSSYFFVIQGLRFNVPEKAYEQVRQGNRRVYYLKRSATLLSVEPEPFQ